MSGVEGAEPLFARSKGSGLDGAWDWPPGRNEEGVAAADKLLRQRLCQPTDDEGVPAASLRAAVFSPTRTPPRPEIARQRRSYSP